MSRPKYVGPPRHGTIVGYSVDGCRCDVCRAVAAAYKRSQVAGRHGLPPEDPRHGTQNGYRDWRCRCDVCRAAWASWVAARREIRMIELDADDPRHGQSSTYINYGCRCPDCRAAKAAYVQRYRQRTVAS